MAEVFCTKKYHFLRSVGVCGMYVCMQETALVVSRSEQYSQCVEHNFVIIPQFCVLKLPRSKQQSLSVGSVVIWFLPLPKPDLPVDPRAGFHRHGLSIFRYFHTQIRVAVPQSVVLMKVKFRPIFTYIHYKHACKML